MGPESYTVAQRTTFLRNFITRFEMEGTGDKQLEVARQSLAKLAKEADKAR